MTTDFDLLPKHARKELDFGRSVFGRGASGLRVKRVQEWLCHHKIRTGVDGKFGPATARCVDEFQHKKSKNRTGKVDRATWEVLTQPLRDALARPATSSSGRVSRKVASIAKRHLKQHPIEIGGPNQGPWVRLYCEGNDGPDWAWCAGFVSYIMHQAYIFAGAQAPIRGSVSCDTLAAQAKEAGLFIPATEVVSGRVTWSDFGGCAIFLKRRTPTDWVHAGFALGMSGQGRDIVFSTIEGNTNDEGSREGYEACERKRSLQRSNYDFIRFA
jgi:hypothetical protein